MECIICQDAGPEPLHDSKLCTCKYKIHSHCWIEYLNSTNKVKCVCCRTEFTSVPLADALNLYSKQQATSLNKNIVSDSYQALRDTPLPRPTAPPLQSVPRPVPRPPQPQSVPRPIPTQRTSRASTCTSEKTFRLIKALVIAICAVAVVITIIIIL